MRSGFILSCESTIDLPYSYCEQRDIPVLFYSYQVDGVSYEDDMGPFPSMPSPAFWTPESCRAQRS